jgi:hypothetical protein
MKEVPLITWVNHAGYVVSYKNINLLVDPWHSGTSFNDGWKLLTNTYFPRSLKDKINYIWISHEHPDHFSPRDIVKLDKNNRIKIIFQKTKDNRVLNFLNQRGFEVIQLNNYEEFKIHHNFRVRIIKNDEIDSLSIFEVNKKIIINTNDCVLSEKKLSFITKKANINHSDILLTQFSYASWIGNPNQYQMRKKASKEKLEQIKSQIKYFKPKITIPFASYVYFSHYENQYMNDEITKLEDVKKVINNNGSKALFLFPGSKYDITNNDISKFDKDYKKYNKIFSKLKSLKFDRSKKIKYSLLEINSKKYLQELYKKNGKLIMRIFYYFSLLLNFFLKKDILGFSKTLIYLNDIKKYVEFNWRVGLKLINKKNISADVDISSDSLNYIFIHQWGIGSLMINGRGTYKNEYTKWKFIRIFSLGLINSHGQTLLRKSLEKFFFIIQKKLEDTDPSFLDQSKLNR